MATSHARPSSRRSPVLLAHAAVISEACADAFAVLYPVVCVGCGRPDRDLCGACRSQLAAFPRHVRLVAGVRCDALYEYTGLARSVVLGYKVHCRTRLARTIGPPLGALVRAATDAAPSGALVLRVPSSRSGALRRGFDPVTLALRHGGLRADGVLRRTRGGDSSGQKSRTAIERVAATVGSLRAHGVRGRAVILVDDVVTTGTTMAEAVRAVRAAGGSVVRCVALAGVEQ